VIALYFIVEVRTDGRTDGRTHGRTFLGDDL